MGQLEKILRLTYRSLPFMLGSLAIGFGGCGNGTPGTVDASGGSALGGAFPSGGNATGGAVSAGGTGGQGSATGSGGTLVTGGSPNGLGGGFTGGGPGDAGGSQGAGGSRDPETFRTATELVSSLSLGWNLGNSLDAPEGETAWGNPTITPALLMAVKSAGFDAVRIPVTWTLHTGPAPTFTIEPTFLTRVAEVVGYAKAAGLPAIINLHHDGADEYEGVEWLTLNDGQGDVTPENNAAVEARFVAIWRQIAEHFKGHDENLLFESMNEIHDGYDAPDPAYYEIIHHLNQVFVDLVRESGGNNAERCLVVPGYNTNIDYTLAGFERPDDVANDRLILSVHFYDPWSYAGEGSTHTWGAASPGSDSWGQETYVVDQYSKLKTQFIDQGLPMIVGEYGAVHQADYEPYRRYYMEYVTKVMVDRGLVPFYWDNGSASSGMDGFGLLDRSTGSILHPTILAAMLKAATESYPLDQVPEP